MNWIRTCSKNSTRFTLTKSPNVRPYGQFKSVHRIYTLSPSNDYLVTDRHHVTTDETEFEKKQLERIKIFPQKRERVSGIDSPTLREIANQNAKRLRVDG